MISRKVLIVTIGVILSFILAPIVIYTLNFYKAGLANEPNAWGVFGDFFGGVLNPIISLASLCVLGYLTYLIGRQTSKDSKDIFMLERKMLAYDELAKHTSRS